MTKDDLVSLIEKVVERAEELKDKQTDQNEVPVNYACIFTHSDDEFKEFSELSLKLGAVIEETPSGPLFKIRPLKTSAGKLRLLKIRKPYKERPERGDADFTVRNYKEFKSKYLKRPQFNLIERKKMEMMELIDPDSDVLVYFSHPPLDEVLGVK